MYLVLSLEPFNDFFIMYGAATDYCIIVPMKLMWGVLGALATSATACRSFVFLSNFRSAARTHSHQIVKKFYMN